MTYENTNAKESESCCFNDDSSTEEELLRVAEKRGRSIQHPCSRCFGKAARMLHAELVSSNDRVIGLLVEPCKQLLTT